MAFNLDGTWGDHHGQMAEPADAGRDVELTRPSIAFETLAKAMDARIKPAHDMRSFTSLVQQGA